ncbi:MAG: hypothetical protein M3R52_01705, partial [Acidobacteriota bacterium]|nr:hypothetical protein [Acidobacteriota bacterium]
MRPAYLIIITVVLFAIGPTSQLRQGQAKLAPAVTFVEVPPSVSKITWTHDNARSEAHHLPETCGG